MEYSSFRLGALYTNKKLKNCLLAFHNKLSLVVISHISSFRVMRCRHSAFPLRTRNVHIFAYAYGIKRLISRPRLAIKFFSGIPFVFIPFWGKEAGAAVIRGLFKVAFIDIYFSRNSLCKRLGKRICQ